MKKIFYILAVLLLFAISSINAQTTVTLYPTTDVTIYADQEEADINSEVFTCGFTKKTYWKDGMLIKKLVEKRSLIKFDLSSIPQNASILNVELTLYGVNHIMPYESFLQLITEDWDENSLTWENQPLATNENSISIAPTSDPFANYQLDLSNFVSAWKNGTINNGLLFRTGSEYISGNGYFEFASSDYPDAAMHPKLEISYIIPDGSSCAMAVANDLDSSNTIYTIAGEQFWSKFTANDTAITVNISRANTREHFPSFSEMIIYQSDANCDNLMEVQRINYSLTDSIYSLLTTNLQIGNTYYLKLLQYPDEEGAYSSGVFNILFDTGRDYWEIGMFLDGTPYEFGEIANVCYKGVGRLLAYHFHLANSDLNYSIDFGGMTNVEVIQSTPSFTLYEIPYENISRYRISAKVTDRLSNLTQLEEYFFINVAPFSPELVVSKFDNCENKQVVITYNTCQNLTYTLYFGDGSESVQTNVLDVPHTYNNPGFYNITSVDNLNNTISQVIEILPSLAGYNENCCISDYSSYDEIDLTIGNGSTIYVETWSTNKQIKGTITIKNQATLLINNNAEISFGPQGKIIVEQGGNLIVRDATLTGINYPNCGMMMWRGIEVWGVKSNTGQSTSIQGEVRLYNATIKHAHNAIIAAKTILVPSQIHPNGFERNAIDGNSVGGIVYAYNSHFDQNARSILIWNFKNSKSEISGCDFNSTDFLLDPYYRYIPTSNFYYDKVVGGVYVALLHNPHLPDCFGFNNSGSSLRYGYSRNHIELEKVTGKILLRNNTYLKAFCAVNAVNSNSNIFRDDDNSTAKFEDNIWGVQIQDPGSLGGAIVKNYDFFIKNHTPITYNPKNTLGVKTVNGRNNMIIGNYFEGYDALMPTFSELNPLAIAVHRSTYYTIKDNFCYLLNVGFLLRNNGSSASSIYNNSFDKTKIAIATGNDVIEDNTGVQIKCNHHINSRPLYYKDNWLNYGKMSNQGIYGTGPNDPAGNRFYDPTRNHLRNYDPTSFTYYHHNDIYYTPADRLPSSTSPITIINTLAAVDIFKTCVDGTITPGTETRALQQIQLYNTELDQLNEQKTVITDALDNAQTTLLLAAINGNTASGSLKNLLLASSPLSDTVLISTLENKKNLAPGLIKEIIIPNSPVSNKVAVKLNEKIATFPLGIKKQIQDAQIGYSNTTITGINRQITDKNTLKGNLTLNLLNFYLEQDSVDLAVKLLENENTVEAKQLLIGNYLEEQNYAKVTQLLAEIPDEDPALMVFKELSKLLMLLSIAEKTIWDLDSIQFNRLKEIASMCPDNSASLHARYILRIAYAVDIPECLVTEMETRTGKPNIQIENQAPENLAEKQKKMFLGNNIPNPVSQKTWIPYLLPTNVNEAFISLTDLSGKPIRIMKLDIENCLLEIDVSDLENGLYIYSLITNGKTIESKRMSVIK